VAVEPSVFAALTPALSGTTPRKVSGPPATGTSSACVPSVVMRSLEVQLVPELDV
jgi:hypothetical protein